MHTNTRNSHFCTSFFQKCTNVTAKELSFIQVNMQKATWNYHFSTHLQECISILGTLLNRTETSNSFFFPWSNVIYLMITARCIPANTSFNLPAEPTNRASPQNIFLSSSSYWDCPFRAWSSCSCPCLHNLGYRHVRIAPFRPLRRLLHLPESRTQRAALFLNISQISFFFLFLGDLPMACALWGEGDQKLAEDELEHNLSYLLQGSKNIQNREKNSRKQNNQRSNNAA